MATSYPGGLDDFAEITTQKQNQAVGGRDHRQMHNDLGDAVEAIQAELGTDPAGSEATVKARIAAAETAISGKAATSHTHSQSDVTGLTAALADVDTRVPMPAVGEWLANGFSSGSTASNVTQNRMMTYPLNFSRIFEVDQASLHVATNASGAIFKLVIYNLAGNMVAESNLDTSGTTGRKTLTFDSSWTPDFHMRAAILRTDANGGSFTIAGTQQIPSPANLATRASQEWFTTTSGSPPNPLTVTGTNAFTHAPLIAFRRSA